MAARKTGAVIRRPLGPRISDEAALATVAAIGPKIARGLRAVLQASGGTIAIECEGPRTSSYAQWQRGSAPTVALAQYRDRAIRGGVLCALPVALIAAQVDRFFGGSGAIAPGQPRIGVAEERLLARLAVRLAEVLAAGWADILPLSPAVVATSFTDYDIAFGAANMRVIVQPFEFTDADTGSGSIDLVYPLAALQALPAPVVRKAHPAEIADPHWRERLADAVMQTRFRVRTVIARPDLPLSRLIALAPGDLIPLTLPAFVPVTVGGRLIAQGTIGEANGRAALKIASLEHGAPFDD